MIEKQKTKFQKHTVIFWIKNFKDINTNSYQLKASYRFI